MKEIQAINRQNGLAMATALIVLIALTLIVLSGSRNSTLQLRMASNLEARVEAVQQAQAGLDFVDSIPASGIITDPGIFYSGNDPYGYSADSNNKPIRDFATIPAGLDIDTVSSKGWLYLLRDNRVSAVPEEVGDMELGWNAAFFNVISGYDDTAGGRGRAELSAGVFKLNPPEGSVQTGTLSPSELSARLQ